MIPFDDSFSTSISVERLSSICIILTSAEWLAHSQALSDQGLASWRVSQLARKWTAGNTFNATIGRALTYPRVLAVVGLRLVGGTGLLLGPADADAFRCACALGVVLASSLLHIRSPYGHDGADQMATLSILALGLSHAVGGPEARRYALWFIAGQSCLSYFTAGVAKLVSPTWRRGIALPGILATRCYGQPRVGAFLGEHHALALTGCWLVIGLESLFPLALVASTTVAVAILASAALLHLANIALMRLNSFFWAFVATYPAVLLLRSDMQTLLGPG